MGTVVLVHTTAEVRSRIAAFPPAMPGCSRNTNDNAVNMNPRSAVNQRDSPGRRGVQTQLRLLRHVIAALYLSATAVGIAQGILAPEVPELAVVDGEVVEPREEQLPRILTVLTTYSGRSEFVREYRNAIGDRNEMIFVVSDEDDEDLDGNIDFKTGSPEHHRSLTALAEACTRFEGQFDWIALGDDDTFFMLNRAEAFLKYIDHTQPLAISKPNGLDGIGHGGDVDCFTREQKKEDEYSANGCCKDFTQPCPVSKRWPGSLRDELGRNRPDDYGPGGLYWPYGGSGAFLSVGLMNALGGAEGLMDCAERLSQNTDVLVGMCMKGYGYAVGDYRRGFVKHARSLEPESIGGMVLSDCQVLGVHLGIRHGPGGTEYGPEAMGEAVKELLRVDELVGSVTVESSCPWAWEQLQRWLQT